MNTDPELSPDWRSIPNDTVLGETTYSMIQAAMLLCNFRLELAEELHDPLQRFSQHVGLIPLSIEQIPPDVADTIGKFLSSNPGIPITGTLEDYRLWAESRNIPIPNGYPEAPIWRRTDKVPPKPFPPDAKEPALAFPPSDKEVEAQRNAFILSILQGDHIANSALTIIADYIHASRTHIKLSKASKRGPGMTRQTLAAHWLDHESSRQMKNNGTPSTTSKDIVAQIKREAIKSGANIKKVYIGHITKPQAD